ncbi:hypothetical protein PSV09DRAFT_2255533 [Bipolaris maydis]|uniref:uncharacterized protein n=1 Tax=Cochliobolus heterostrophus TaxID=5016 RepID=UPI0024D7667A|nr:hypothetical protein J3E73DRAFT_260578 [Bipolaris maydis]KAJ5041467.1 hypothetical protein J3E74DRAFT_296415 [Bipolaris maydis]KAJ5055918.1 hypothetical protein J3E74DRAFT_294292 [Bipolaris maydis]KAJ6212213.1 hypothetical protein PSV09DRAFT_2255533 [Bipolaris maydis]KAJ6266879.1 hypothetical protein PSV08DRAFT_250941 [Bipolaris maydis]
MHGPMEAPTREHGPRPLYLVGWPLWAGGCGRTSAVCGSRLRRADVAVRETETSTPRCCDNRRQPRPRRPPICMPGQACKGCRASAQVAGSTVPNPRVAWNRVIGGPSSSLRRRVPICLARRLGPAREQTWQWHDCSLAAVASCRDAYDASLPWPRGGVGCMLPRVRASTLNPMAAPNYALFVRSTSAKSVSADEPVRRASQPPPLIIH